MKAALIVGLIVGVSSVWLVESLPAKRTKELVLFGNQQNQGHLSVKKSGPGPFLGQYDEGTSADIERELETEMDHHSHDSGARIHGHSENPSPTSHGSDDHAEKKKSHSSENHHLKEDDESQLEKELSASDLKAENHHKVSSNDMAHMLEDLAQNKANVEKKSPKEHHHNKVSRQHKHHNGDNQITQISPGSWKHKLTVKRSQQSPYHPNAEEKAELMKLKHRLLKKAYLDESGESEAPSLLDKPKRVYDGELHHNINKKMVPSSLSLMKKRSAPSISSEARLARKRRSMESSMGSPSIVHRKKRAAPDFDPETLRDLQIYIDAMNRKEEAERTSEEQPYYYPLNEDQRDLARMESEEMSPMMMNPPMMGRMMQPDGLSYTSIVHEGIPGLFIPYDQPEAEAIRETLEEQDESEEEEKLRELASYLGQLSPQKRTYEEDDSPYGINVVERRNNW